MTDGHPQLYMPLTLGFGPKNKEVFAKHEKAPTAPRFEGVWLSRICPCLENQSFWAFLANFWWPKGISTHQDLSFEPIHMSVRPSVTKKHPRKNSYFGKKPLFFGHCGHIRPNSVVKSGRNCQKAHLHAKPFHMSLFPGLYDHPFQRNILKKNRWRTDRRTDGHPESIRPQPFGLGPNNE